MTVPPYFPILWDHRRMATLRAAGKTTMVLCLPWEMILPHQAQAQRNHSQTLNHLAERGGLSVDEAMAVLEDRDWHQMTVSGANFVLRKLLDAWKQRRIVV